MRPQDKVFTNSDIIGCILSFLSPNDYLKTGLVSQKFRRLAQVNFWQNIAQYGINDQRMLLIDFCLQIINQTLKDDAREELCKNLKNFLSSQDIEIEPRAIALTALIILFLQDKVTVEEKYLYQLSIALDVLHGKYDGYLFKILRKILPMLIQHAQLDYSVKFPNNYLALIDHHYWEPHEIYLYKNTLGKISDTQSDQTHTIADAQLNIDTAINAIKIQAEKFGGRFHLVVKKLKINTELLIKFHTKLSSEQARQLALIYLSLVNDISSVNNYTLEIRLLTAISRNLDANDTKLILLHCLNITGSLNEYALDMIGGLCKTLQTDAAAMARISIIEVLVKCTTIYVDTNYNLIILARLVQELTYGFSADQAENLLQLFINLDDKTKVSHLMLIYPLVTSIFTPTLVRRITVEKIQHLYSNLLNLFGKIRDDNILDLIALRILRCISKKLDHEQLEQFIPKLIEMANRKNYDNYDWIDELTEVLVRYSYTETQFSDLLDSVNSNPLLMGALIAKFFIYHSTSLSFDSIKKYLPILINSILLMLNAHQQYKSLSIRVEGFTNEITFSWTQCVALMNLKMKALLIIDKYQTELCQIFSEPLGHLADQIVDNIILKRLFYFYEPNTFIALWNIFNEDQRNNIFENILFNASGYNCCILLLNVFDKLTPTQQKKLYNHTNKNPLILNPAPLELRLINCLINLSQEYKSPKDSTKMKQRAIQLVDIYCRFCRTLEELRSIEKQLEKSRLEGKLNHLANRQSLQLGWLSVPSIGSVNWHQWIDDSGNPYECSGTWSKIMKTVQDYMTKMSGNLLVQDYQFLSITGSGWTTPTPFR